MNFITVLQFQQTKAVAKLKKVKVGALYMEQGTGKTRTMLELIDMRLQKGKINHVIWLCPCSAKENLRKEFIKHTGSEQNELITICGIETLSSSIRENSRLLKLVQKKNCYIIADESNLIKNFIRKRTKNIIRLSEYCQYKMILNGTPITRNEVDLFAQWYFLDWRILGYKSLWGFQANHVEWDERIKGKVRRTLNVDYLAEKISPYTYQIKKSECLDLPPKTYETIYYTLTDEQWEHYRYIADALLMELDEMEPHTIYRLFIGLQNVISGFLVNVDGKNMTKTDFFSNPLDNPRMETLLNVLENTGEEKVIIFCKYTKEIIDIVNILNEIYGEDAAVRFDGKITQKRRNENMEKFHEKSRFLVSNKTCAGYSLNLQFCSYMIFYTNDFNYGTRAQGEDRIHRFGQDKNVHIIDICATRTLDERILECLNRKENILESFKNEIEKIKDKQELKEWFFVKENRKRVRYDSSDLIERSTNAEDIYKHECI